MFVHGLFHAVTNTHILHLQTRSFSVHSALGNYYVKLDKLVDRFAEAYQGKYGIIEGYKALYYLPPPSALEYLIQISEFISQTRVDLPQDSELQNLVDEIQSETDSTIYKLRFLS
jgi:DNA-binding ferritin-like protein